MARQRRDAEAQTFGRAVGAAAARLGTIELVALTLRIHLQETGLPLPNVPAPLP